MDSLKSLGFLGIALGIAAVVGVATPSTAGAQGASVVEEIIVTARKREENIQDIGISVSAMGQQEIQNQYSTDIRDLVAISPNLVIDDTAQGPGGVASIYIRGIGVSEVEKNFDPAVGVVIDGIYIGTMTGGLQRTIDLERMEVLRGPQGTLFGRNTIGGVVNMERTKPTKELGGTVRAGYGDYDTSVLEGLVNFGLGEQVGLKLTGAYRNQDEGYYTSTCNPNITASVTTPPCTTNGQDVGAIEYTNFGANLLWTATDNLEFEYTYDKEETTQDTPPLVNASQPNSPPLPQSYCDNFASPPGNAQFCAPSLTTPTSGGRLNTDQVVVGPRSTFENGPGNPTVTYPNGEPKRDATFDTETHIGEAHWGFADNYQMDLIVGRWETDETVLTDWDGTSDVTFHTDRPAEYEQTTAELRFSGENGPFNWTVGGYYWDSEYEIRLVSVIGFFGPPFAVPIIKVADLGIPPIDLPQFTRQESESWAVFGEADWAFTDTLTLTLGGRFTEDDKSTEQRGQVPCGLPGFGGVLPPPLDTDCASDPNTPVTASKTWDEFTPRVGLKWAITDDSMTYATYSAGYRSGGFNGRVDSVETAATPYDQETVDNFEVGYKSEWFENRVRFNTAIFYMKYDDKQEEIQLPSGSSGTGQKTFVVNAADATITGIEFEVIAVPVNSVNLRANLGFLDAEYDNFTYDANPGGVPNIVDNSHLNFRRAPDFTGSFGAEWVTQLGSGDMRIGGTWHYIGEHDVDFANKPELENDAQNLVDAAISYEYKWDSVSALASLYGRNLLDEDGYTIGFDVSGLWSYAHTRPPRTWGVEAVVRFGGGRE
jgi:iron complex outermembrane receptor protein